MNKRSEADEIMIRAVSILGRARSLKDRAKLKAIIELKRGASLMNKAVRISPDSVPNRFTRLRHLLGVTMRSPIKYYKEVETDFKYLEQLFDILNPDDQANFLSAKGEYALFKGEREKGLKLIKQGAEISPETSMGMYSQTLYDSLLKD